MRLFQMADILPRTIQYDTKHCNYKELPLFLAIFLKTQSLELACIALCPFPNTICVDPLHGCLSIPFACIYFICVYPLSTSCVFACSCAFIHFMCLYPFLVLVFILCACILFMCLHPFLVLTSISCACIHFMYSCIHFLCLYPFCAHVSMSYACIHLLCLHPFHVRVSISYVLVCISCA